jgi:hypothetical protein
MGHGILFGYFNNEAGFGWTNAVFTALFDQLPAAAQRALAPWPRWSRARAAP